MSKISSSYNPVLSIMKGVAIFGVVLGHCSSSSFIDKFVNQWHLAVFFFVAGYLFKDEYLHNIKLFLVGKIKRLYIPFIVSGLIFLILHNFFFYLSVYEERLTISELTNGVFDIVVKMTTKEQLMGAMWFCPALLEVSIISYASLYFFKKKIIAVVFPFIVGATCLFLLKIKSPYCVWHWSIVSCIFFIGYLLRKKEEAYYIRRISSSCIYSIIVVLIFLSLIVLMTKYEIYGSLQAHKINNENPFIIIIIATCGCLMVYFLSKLLWKCFVGKIFDFIGKYSFSIMLLHFLSFKIVNCYLCKVIKLPGEISDFPTISHGTIMTPFYLLVGVFIPIMCQIIYNRIILKSRFAE